MSSRNTQYRELFRIDCLHGYFADGRCDALTVNPTRECSALLNRYGCLFRPILGGGVVNYAVAGGQSLLRLFDEKTPFAFALAASDSLLTTFTETDAGMSSPLESAYCFNNAQEHVATVAGTERFLLHPEGKSLTAGPLPVRPGVFNYTLVQVVNGASFEVVDIFGQSVFKGQTPAFKTNAIALDLNGLGPGRYSLRVQRQDPYDFYLSNAPGRPPWGFVDIFAGGSALANLVPERCRVIDAQGSVGTPPVFTIALEPRKSIWRYYIVSQSPDRRSFDDYAITGAPVRGTQSNGAGTTVFSTPVRQKVNGKDAWVFESQSAVPLFEAPGGHHEFVLKGNGGNGAGLFSLPYAQTETTRLERAPDGNGSRMCSEIYVYL